MKSPSAPVLAGTVRGGAVEDPLERDENGSAACSEVSVGGGGEEAICGSGVPLAVATGAMSAGMSLMAADDMSGAGAAGACTAGSATGPAAFGGTVSLAGAACNSMIGIALAGAAIGPTGEAS